MSEDVPLSAFQAGGDETDDDENGDGSSEETEPVETPSLTYTSSPAGAACAACGETVEKRWRAGEGGVSGDETGNGGVDDPEALVCPNCKEW